MTHPTSYVLRGAVVVDGTGAAPKTTDVRIEHGSVASVGHVGRSDGAVSVDLEGLVLAPGFIDPHTHYDGQALWDPDLAPSSWHGVTTAIMGNCGFGFAPTRPSPGERMRIMRTLENVEGMPLDALAAGIDWSFETFSEYLDLVESKDKRINVGAFIGHSPVRLYVMGGAATEREASVHEIDLMRGIVAEALTAGAFGFSTSFAPQHYGPDGKPVPSRLSSSDEVYEISAALGQVNRGVVTVAVGPGFFLDECAELLVRVGRPVVWGAAATGFDGLTNFNAPPGAALDLVERAGRRGLVTQICALPVLSQVAAIEPTPMIPHSTGFLQVVQAAVGERPGVYADPAWRESVKRDMGLDAEAIWSRLWVEETATGGALIGASLAERARERGVDALDLFADTALSDGLRTRFRQVIANSDEDELALMLGAPQTLISLGDAGAHLGQMCTAGYPSHVLGHWVREREALTLEDAVWQMTGRVASLLGVRGRGLIRPGFAADLVAFDADTVGMGPPYRVSDLPGGADRLLTDSVGIEHVWVNGRPIRRGGADLHLTGSHPGQLLRSR